MPSSSLLASAPEAAPLPAECLPNYDLIVTEDDTPVDSLISEREMKLLTDPLHASWSGPGEGRSFVCMSNVGLFFAPKKPPLVPDFLLSLDVAMPTDALPKEHRSYFIWKYGKPPDLVIEIVSNKEGGEADVKWNKYAQLGITYYVIHDPFDELEGGVLRAFMLRDGVYEPMDAPLFPEIGLGLTLWHGHYAGMRAEWLRWCDCSGRLLLTGAERAIQAEQRLDQEQQRADQEQQRALQEQQRADQEQQRADLEQQRADLEQQRADQEKQRAERLAAQLRSLGIEPAG
ncbi:MAG: Uma2 family endonuclease [Planctomycetaceae bacterium]